MLEQAIIGIFIGWAAAQLCNYWEEMQRKRYIKRLSSTFPHIYKEDAKRLSRSEIIGLYEALIEISSPLPEHKNLKVILESEMLRRLELERATKKR